MGSTLKSGPLSYHDGWHIMLNTDWFDKDKVVAYAKQLGRGMTVFRNHGQTNYNITHTERLDRYAGHEVIYQT
jgi:hypothetical protein